MRVKLIDVRRESRSVSGATFKKAISIALLSLCTVTFPALADLKPETITRTKMAKPSATWLFVKQLMGPAYIFDTATGDMKGLMSVSGFTPALEPNNARGEIYAAESFYSRGTRGTRTDVVSIYDMETLSPTEEIVVPKKLASLPFRQYISLLDDGKHLVVFNMTPAQSVSIVNVAKRKFVQEISTPGCALTLPVENRSFLQMCGDGTLQLIGLNRKGEESSRSRSEGFFKIDEDPVYDKPVPAGEGWMLISFDGKIFDASVKAGEISVSEPWSILTEEDKKAGWRPGGGQILAYHHQLDLVFTLMHQGGTDTHEEPGNEVWVFDNESRRRVARISLAVMANNLSVSQNEDALLTVSGIDSQLHVYDVRTTKLVRTISQIGGFVGLLQGFSQ